MLDILKAIIFGIVEGITEWLPISSTGHLIILEELLKLNQGDAFFEMFQVVIQLQQFFHNDQMPRTADRKPFSNSFHDTKNDRF